MANYYQPEIETMPREQMRALQSERLVKTVRHVWEHVPFYRARMEQAKVSPEDIRSVDDLSKLPFTCKQDLRDTYPYGLFAVPMKDIVRLHASSGTTGKQIVVGYTQHDLDLWADCCARALTAAGGTKEDIVHISYGYGLFTGGLGIDGGARRLGAATVPVSSGNTQRQITILQDFGSTILCCTPSYALHIAEVLRDSGLTKGRHPRLKAGIFGAEPWTAEMRAQIEQMLGIKRLRHLRAHRDHRPRRRVRVLRADGHARERGPLPRRGQSTPRRASRCPTASRASWSSPASRSRPSPSCATARTTSASSSTANAPAAARS
jgi:phenylacetate-CoA ligase